jgi:hypothetical protein
MSETKLLKEIQATFSRGETRLWRNNVGEAWAGRAWRCADGLIIKDPMRINFGLCPGSSDLIGFKSVRITQEMVGQDVAIFTAIEVKVPGARMRPGQDAFLTVLRGMGGVAGVARSVEDAGDILAGAR